AIMTMMTSPRLLGYKVHKGKPAAGPDGAPVRIAEPVLSHEEFQRVQNALDARSTRSRTRGTTPLLGVVKCGVCGSNASRWIRHTSGKQYVYYRCNQRGAFRSSGCTSAHVDRVMGVVTRAFLAQLRDVRVL